MTTTYFLNCIAGNVFATSANPQLPTKYYLGLSKTAPSLDGSNVTEPSKTAGYARVEITGLSTPQNGVVSNTTPLVFNESTGSWGVVTHYVIYDSQTVGGGNLLMYGELSTSRTIDAATTVNIQDGSLSLSVFNK